MKVWYLALLATLKAVPALAAPFAYVPNGASCTVSVIGTADDSVVASVTETRLCGASGVVISVDGTQAYVTRRALALDGITVIDTATESVITEVFTGPGSEPAGLAVTPDGASLYVALAGYSRIAVIDTASLAVSGGVSVADFIISPQGVASTPDGASVYVAGDSAVAVIDTATSNVIGIAVNNGALDVAITPDGAFAYVSNGNLTFGVISVIAPRRAWWLR